MSDIQALPTQFENTASTWQNMPAMAAMYTGQQNQIAQDNNAALQQAFANEQAYKQQERPVTLQNLVNTGQLTAAQAAHYNQLSNYSRALTDRYTQETPSSVMASTFENINKAATAQVGTGAANAAFDAQQVNNIARMPAPTDPISAQADATRILQAAGHPVTPESIQYVVQNREEAVKALQAEVEQRAQSAAMGTPQGRVTQAGLDTKVRISEDRFNQAVAVEAQKAQVAAANKAADAVRAVVVVQEKALNSFKDQATALNRQALAETDPGKKAILKAEADKANAVAAAMTSISQQTSNEAKLGVAALIDPSGKLGVKLPTPSVPSLGNGAQPTPNSPGEQTATNPTTGEKVVLRNGQWVPVGTPPSTVSPQSQSAPSNTPAPMRNNNPGALMPRGKLASFPTPEAGLEALNNNLKDYGTKGVDTLEGVVSRWAPPSENDTASYIADVAKRTGLSPQQKIDLNNPYVRHILSAAIIVHENGQQAITQTSPSGTTAVVPNPAVGGTSPPIKTPVLPRIVNKPSYSGWLAAKEAKDTLYNEAVNMSPDRRETYINSRLPEIEQAMRFHSGYLNSK